MRPEDQAVVSEIEALRKELQKLRRIGDAMLEYTSSALDTLSLDAPFLPTADPAAEPPTAPTGLPLEEETAADESGMNFLKVPINSL